MASLILVARRTACPEESVWAWPLGKTVAAVAAVVSDMKWRRVSIRDVVLAKFYPGKDARSGAIKVLKRVSDGEPAQVVHSISSLAHGSMLQN